MHTSATLLLLALPCMMGLHLGGDVDQDLDPVDPPDYAKLRTLPIYKTAGDPAGNPCSHFLHIPRTGGQSIEESGRMHGKFRGHSPHFWGSNAVDLQCSAWNEKARKDEDRDPRVLVHDKCKIMHTNEPKDPVCPKEFVPPSRDSKVARYYSHCPTFCVVRSPTSRLLSIYLSRGRHNRELKKQRPCNEGAIKAWVKEQLKEANHIFRDGCRFVSQSEYVYGKNEVVQVTNNTKKYCDYVIHQENLTRAFNDVMENLIGSNVFLSNRNYAEFAVDYSKCDKNLDVVKLMSPLVNHMYTADLANFGYDH